MDNYGICKKARLRVRAARFKDSPHLILLNRPLAQSHQSIMSYLRYAVEKIDQEGDGQITGFALVAWEKADDYRWTFAKTSRENPIWSSEVPGYVERALRYLMKPGQHQY